MIGRLELGGDGCEGPELAHWKEIQVLDLVVLWLAGPISKHKRWPNNKQEKSKGAGSFHIHRKTMKDLCALAVLGVREQPNLAHNLVTYRY